MSRLLAQLYILRKDTFYYAPKYIAKQRNKQINTTITKGFLLCIAEPYHTKTENSAEIGIQLAKQK